jgi:hypothetical protein
MVQASEYSDMVWLHDEILFLVELLSIAEKSQAFPLWRFATSPRYAHYPRLPRAKLTISRACIQYVLKGAH